MHAAILLLDHAHLVQKQRVLALLSYCFTILIPTYDTFSSSSNIVSYTSGGASGSAAADWPNERATAHTIDGRTACQNPTADFHLPKVLRDVPSHKTVWRLRRMVHPSRSDQDGMARVGFKTGGFEAYLDGTRQKASKKVHVKSGKKNPTPYHPFPRPRLKGDAP